MQTSFDDQSASSTLGDVDIFPIGGILNVSINASNPSTGHTRNNSHGSEAQYIPLTAEALHEHNLKRVASSALPEYRHDIEQRYAVGPYAPLSTPYHDPTCGLDAQNTALFESIMLSGDAPSDTVANHIQNQREQRNRKDTHRERGRNAATDPSTDRRYPNSSYQGNSAYMLKRDEDIVDCDYIDSDQEVAACGNDLAGVGAHLEGYSHQDGLDEFVMD
jgi:hypothetical protein